MLPAQRQSHGRTRRRRAHDSLSPITPTVDPFGAVKRHHRVSKETGYVRPGLKIVVPKLKIGTER